jgi:hypothetical protein
MRNLTTNTQYGAGVKGGTGQVAVWNRRLLIGAIALVLWAASMLALQAMGPDARALMAGEGLLIQVDQ